MDHALLRSKVAMSPPIIAALIAGITSLLIAIPGAMLTWWGLRQKQRSDNATNNAAMTAAQIEGAAELRADLFKQIEVLRIQVSTYEANLRVEQEHSREQDLLIRNLTDRIAQGDKERAVLAERNTMLYELLREVRQEIGRLNQTTGATTEQLQMGLSTMDQKIETVMVALGMVPAEGSIIIPKTALPDGE